MAQKTALAIVLALTSANALAFSSTPSTQELVKVAIDQSKLSTSSGRQALAKAVNAYCKDVQAVYPRNSPSEEEWLNGEIDGGGSRAEKALTSPELGRRMAKRFTHSCITSSDWAVKRPDQSIYFVILAHEFIRFSGDASYFAKRNGVNGEQYWLEGIPRMTAEALSWAAIMIETDKGTQAR